MNGRLWAVIHTTADFEFADLLVPKAVDAGVVALRRMQDYTDTRMAEAGINKKALKSLGCEIKCYRPSSSSSDGKRNGHNRSMAS